jgi:TRAP-type mannitol/chloroaromatic compound transport system substrate-binding protein
MVVRQLPGGEIQPAMKTGLIEAAEFNNPTSDSQFGVAE